jgi:flavin reductase (DIM6/NTAB) family NADH-FMN oxidoreductase RutF
MRKVKVENRPVGPFPTVLAGADVGGRPNFATVGACGVVCLEPVVYVSLKDTHLTTRGVAENGFFSVNMPSVDLVEKTDVCGLVSGEKYDKSWLFTIFYDETGRAPLIQECPINLLCKVIQSIRVFGFTMFLGEIVASYVSEQCLTDGAPDPRKVNPVIMMGDSYWDLGSTVGAVFRAGEPLKSSIPPR